MTEMPTPGGSGRAYGYPLFISPTGPSTGVRDNLLLTALEGNFEGSPYPRPGIRVRLLGGNPPWLVVDHYLDRVIVWRWPVRLWTRKMVFWARPSSIMA